MLNQELYVHCREVKFHSTNLFVVFFLLDLANLKMYESYTTFFYPFDFSNGIKLRYRYTESRIMSCKSADIDEVFVFLQN